METSGKLRQFSGWFPQLDWAAVRSIRYTLHQQAGTPGALLVSYYCGDVNVSELIFIGHKGPARAAAVRWWLRRSSTRLVPAGLEDAFNKLDGLRRPSHIALIARQDATGPKVVGVRFDDPEPPSNIGDLKAGPWARSVRKGFETACCPKPPVASNKRAKSIH